MFVILDSEIGKLPGAVPLREFAEQNIKRPTNFFLSDLCSGQSTAVIYDDI